MGLYTILVYIIAWGGMLIITLSALGVLVMLVLNLLGKGGSALPWYGWLDAGDGD